MLFLVLSSSVLLVSEIEDLIRGKRIDVYSFTAGPRVAGISAAVCAGVAGAWTVLVDVLTG